MNLTWLAYSNTLIEWLLKALFTINIIFPALTSPNRPHPKYVANDPLN